MAGGRGQEGADVRSRLTYLALSPRTPQRIVGALRHAAAVLYNRVIFPTVAITSAIFMFWFVNAAAALAQAGVQ